MKFRVLAFLFAAACGNSTFAACLPAPVTGEDVKLTDKSGKVRLVAQDNVDRPVQSTLTQSYAFIDVKPAPTEAQVRGALNQLYSNARLMCRRTALTGVRIFLYTSPTTSVSSSWVARLNAENMRPVIDIRDNMLRVTATASAQSCDSSKEPGRSIHMYPKLPPLAKRKILGTWADDTSALTVSLEQVSGTVYKVYRSKYCSSGAEGEPLRKGKQGRYYRKDNRSGDYYVILPGGELGVYDNDGQIDARPAHEGLFPRK